MPATHQTRPHPLSFLRFFLTSFSLSVREEGLCVHWSSLQRLYLSKREGLPCRLLPVSSATATTAPVLDLRACRFLPILFLCFSWAFFLFFFFLLLLLSFPSSVCDQATTNLCKKFEGQLNLSAHDPLAALVRSFPSDFFPLLSSFSVFLSLLLCPVSLSLPRSFSGLLRRLRRTIFFPISFV